MARFLIPVFEAVVRGAVQSSGDEATTILPDRATGECTEPPDSSGPSAGIEHDRFDSRLRSLVPESELSRPFMCAGDPLVARLFIVGLNPGTDVPFWPFWSGCVFDKSGWLRAYVERHGSLRPTRRYLERLIGGLEGVSYLETNLYPYPSRGIDMLSPERCSTDVFEFLVSSIRPRVMFVMGKQTIEFVRRRAGLADLPKGERFTTVRWLELTIDVMAENHFATRTAYWNDRKVDRWSYSYRTIISSCDWSSSTLLGPVE